VLDKNDVTVIADGNLRQAKILISGSPELELLSAINKASVDYELKTNLFNHKFLNMTSNQDSVEIAELRNTYEKREFEYYEYVKRSINSLNGQLIAWLILTEHLNMEQNLAFYEAQLELFSSKISDSWQYKLLLERFISIKKLAIGSVAPDFSLPTPDGGVTQLSSFRGKYLFLDFWASWCQPCRVENPHLLMVYEKYKGPDFEILGISFDKKRENWIKAIEQDGLNWAHASDLKYFDSELIELYNIQNVPTTFLLDPEGKILAKNIHSRELDLMLKEKLKKNLVKS
jgi:peroxiredoxin